jgi:hypothetical protein
MYDTSVLVWVEKYSIVGLHHTWLIYPPFHGHLGGCHCGAISKKAAVSSHVKLLFGCMFSVLMNKILGLGSLDHRVALSLTVQETVELFAQTTVPSSLPVSSI